jgi:hypothetical protein
MPSATIVRVPPVVECAFLQFKNSALILSLLIHGPDFLPNGLSAVLFISTTRAAGDLVLETGQTLLSFLPVALVGKASDFLVSTVITLSGDLFELPGPYSRR